MLTGRKATWTLLALPLCVGLWAGAAYADERLIIGVDDDDTIGDTSGTVTVTNDDLSQFIPTNPPADYSNGTGTWSLFFDGSAIVAPNTTYQTADISTGFNSIAFLNGDLIFSVADDEFVGGTTAAFDFDPEDLIRFSPNVPGVYTPSAGTYSMFLDGSSFGGSSDDINEPIDAIEFLADGSLLLSVSAGDTIRGVAMEDDDIIKFTPTVAGAYLNGVGTWTLFLDGSSFGNDTQDINDDIDALAILPDGSLLISVGGDETIRSIAIEDEDVLKFTPTVAGAYLNGVGTWTTFMIGDSFGPSSEDIDDSDLENLAFLPHSHVQPPPNGEGPVIPEPSSMLLLGLGGMAAGLTSRRRNQHRASLGC